LIILLIKKGKRVRTRKKEVLINGIYLGRDEAPRDIPNRNPDPVPFYGVPWDPIGHPGILLPSSLWDLEVKLGEEFVLVYLIVYESFCKYKIFEVTVVYDYNNLIGNILEFSMLVFEISDNSYKFFVIGLVIILGRGIFFWYKNNRIKNTNVHYKRAANISEPPAPYYQATNIYNFTTTILVFSLNRIGSYWIKRFCNRLAGASVIARFSIHPIALYFRASSPYKTIILTCFLGYLLIYIPLV
jgi:hypothetical protein